ncbi:hypothetical protein BDZ97DRAFT_1922037 [Flammula alnicola]|nr:hypothetical protein BDZ97DRAFT_1922037 [Flammula alnicola]
MVASSSAAAQASENEKRRKQTMEKVKANHLSRQLQMRLQYARLKVEHGWQKQNLNEVENLYFHNSHLRASKPFPAPTITTTQQQQHTSFTAPQSGSAQSSLSFKLGTSNLGRSTVNAGPSLSNEQSKNHTSQEDPSSNHASQAEPIVDHPISMPSSDSSSRVNLPDDPSIPMAVDSDEGTTLLDISTSSVPAVPNGSGENAILAPDDHTPSATDPLASSQDSQSPPDLSHSSSNHYPSAKLSRPRAQKVPSGSKALPSLTAKDMYNFGSNTTLTYDSFWSSHLGSAAPDLPEVC